MFLKCLFYTCCGETDIFNYHALYKDFDNKIFGQHLMAESVVHSIKSHWHNEHSQKPLVLSFHGGTGTGKNYVTEIIVNNTYRSGMHSPFVNYFVATNNFPNKKYIEDYKLELKDQLIRSARRCQRSIFIFDETDKLQSELIQVIKPFLDYYPAVFGVDFRKTIFIFLSNKGSKEIANIALEHHENGKIRSQLELKHFERTLMLSAFNEEGGLRNTDMISNQLIDHFIPFLPLSKFYVSQCIQVHLRKRGRHDLAKDGEFMQRVLDSLEFFPESSKIFSSSGCKRVNAKTDLEISKMGFSLNSKKEFNDEL
ncbi:Torsin [Caenorhabditis elegans]|uniref:Torsin n=1 Tax=Caenorhabditis elegans TaxID=6239 RepID=Q9XXG5_CAEEL|nr:Torsin [Caenorhabditis elegans]CAA19484.2 Torsin [Caenorhabditis elegans]|eukprot:NP_502683.2 Torsin [Caenorhabditis elegans]